MRASKEGAANARKSLAKLSDAIPHDVRQGFAIRSNIVALEEFIEAAAKALPTQAAIDRDRIRKKDLAR